MQRGSTRTVVFAPDSFKGSAEAAQVASALAAGWKSRRPADHVVCVPMADGGEGTLDTVAQSVPEAELVPVDVIGPDDRPVHTHWLRLPDGAALVELAACSGLLLLDAGLRPRTAHTFGTGQAIRAAIDAQATRVYVALGGSASSDGGAGLLMALGARLQDHQGRDIALGNHGLDDLASVDLSHVVLPPHGIVAWTDVRSPLLGEEGAVAVFGAQKGLEGEQAAAAERALERFAALTTGDASLPGAGAAGGVGFGLACVGATLTSGSAAVAEVVDLAGALRGADLVITGEGRFDGQSAEGKVVSQVVADAATAEVPVALVAGRLDADTGQFAHALSLTELAGPEQDPMRDTEDLLHRAGRHLAQSAVL